MNNIAQNKQNKTDILRAQGGIKVINNLNLETMAKKPAKKEVQKVPTKVPAKKGGKKK